MPLRHFRVTLLRPPTGTFPLSLKSNNKCFYYQPEGKRKSNLDSGTACITYKNVYINQ